jgi:hypothetical protein
MNLLGGAECGFSSVMALFFVIAATPFPQPTIQPTENPGLLEYRSKQIGQGGSSETQLQA